MQISRRAVVFLLVPEDRLADSVLWGVRTRKNWLSMGVNPRPSSSSRSRTPPPPLPPPPPAPSSFSSFVSSLVVLPPVPPRLAAGQRAWSLLSSRRRRLRALRRPTSQASRRL
eukprot:4921360-Pyramimonas_sp.AAC.1